MPGLAENAAMADCRVVVLAYGGGDEFVPLLGSLEREGMPIDRVLLVHNPSSPGQRPAPTPAGLEVLPTGRNLGYAAGMNAGIERQLERGCNSVLLLTHDARLRPGALRELLRAAADVPAYGVLGPALLWSDTEKPFSFGGETGPGGRMRHRTTPPATLDGIAQADWIDGGTMLIRSEALTCSGAFDERLWSYCEDADLCLRVARCGFRIGVVTGARADQAPGGAKRPGAWAYLLARNGIAYARSYAGVRGLAAASARAAGTGFVGLARASARALRLRAGSPAEPRAVAIGALRGLVDYAGGRWGPPPAGLPGMGDLSNTAADDDSPGAGHVH
jgi:N-acetylglucosaminyl-diphospho-decaprenol L-rhamnosyltransferase